MSTSWGAIYGEAKQWQTAIGSVLGFIALMLGALYNFRLNRLRDDRLRNEDVKAISAALYGEIILLENALARAANGVGKRFIKRGFHGGEEEFDRFFFEQHPLPEPRLYSTLAEKVGYLSPTILAPIVEFYTSYGQARMWLPKLEPDPNRSFTYGVIWVLEPAVAALTAVQPALRDIEAMVGLEAPDDPDLTDAINALTIEQDWLEEARSQRVA